VRRASEHERHRDGRLTLGAVTSPRGRRIASLFLCASLATSWACTSPPAEDRGEGSTIVEVDGTMPPLEATTLDGSTFSAADLRGTPLVVNFWATWCEPCEREQPLLVQAAEEAGGEVAFLGVDYRDEDDAAREWLARYDVPYPNVADPNGSIGYRLGVTTGLPTTVVVDGDGRLRFRVLGELDRATLDDLIERVTTS